MCKKKKKKKNFSLKTVQYKRKVCTQHGIIRKCTHYIYLCLAIWFYMNSTFVKSYTHKHVWYTITPYVIDVSYTGFTIVLKAD